jgi:tetratricopeptide (TPR) repeat protein
MKALLLCLAAAFPGQPNVEVRLVEGETVVDASGSSVGVVAFLRQLAQHSHRELRGEDVLIDADPVDLSIHDRPLDSVLRALGLSTNTDISADLHAITISPPRPRKSLEDMDLETQAAWLRLVRDFPEHEVSRFARLQLGRAQERLGHDEAALAHYDAAVRTDIESPAMEQALRAASDLLSRRGSWGEAQRRLSLLAVHASAESVRASARIATARALAMQGRGPEALALMDAVDISYPPHGDHEVEDRLLVRARAQLAAGNAPGALEELDRRSLTHTSLGSTREDFELRARALEAAGSPLEAARAWLASASLADGPEKVEALVSAARLAAAGGDDLAVLFIARSADGGVRDSTRKAQVERLADAARAHLGFLDMPAESTDPVHSIDALEPRWAARAKLTPSDRVALAARFVTAVARARTIDDALAVARTALSELDGADGTPVRAALAEIYERRGLWSQAARVWNGGAL